METCSVFLQNADYHDYVGYAFGGDYKKGFRTNIAKYSFGNRVIDEWNRLPSCVIESSSLGVFKGSLDRFLSGMGGV